MNKHPDNWRGEWQALCYNANHSRLTTRCVFEVFHNVANKHLLVVEWWGFKKHNNGLAVLCASPADAVKVVLARFHKMNARALLEGSHRKDCIDGDTQWDFHGSEGDVEFTTLAQRIRSAVGPVTETNARRRNEMNYDKMRRFAINSLRGGSCELTAVDFDKLVRAELKKALGQLGGLMNAEVDFESSADEVVVAGTIEPAPIEVYQQWGVYG